MFSTSTSIEGIIDDLNLRDKPSNIFNCDKMEGISEKVVVSRCTKHSYSTAKGSHEHIIVNACVSAIGHIQVVHMHEMLLTVPFTQRPQMDIDLFYKFIDQHFIPFTLCIEGAKLLILDGYGSHLHLKTYYLCRDNNIHLYCFPPHTTHLYQQLDVVILQPLQAHFSYLTHHLKLATLGMEHPSMYHKINFTKVFKEV